MLRQFCAWPVRRRQFLPSWNTHCWSSQSNHLVGGSMEKLWDYIQKARGLAEPSSPRHGSSDILGHLSRSSTSRLPRSNLMWYCCGTEDLPRQTLFKFLTHKTVRCNANGYFKPLSFGNCLLCSDIKITGMASDFSQVAYFLLITLSLECKQIFCKSLCQCPLPAHCICLNIQWHLRCGLPCLWPADILLLVHRRTSHSLEVAACLCFAFTASYLTAKLSTFSLHSFPPIQVL